MPTEKEAMGFFKRVFPHTEHQSGHLISAPWLGHDLNGLVFSDNTAHKIKSTTGDCGIAACAELKGNQATAEQSLSSQCHSPEVGKGSP